MPYTIAVTANNIYRVNTSGTAVALTLPTDITIVSGRRPRLAVLGRDVIVTNCVTQSLLIDPDFNVTPLQIQPPTSAPALTSAVAGGLSGTFRVKYTYIIKDVNGRVLAESDFSPISASSGAITSKLLKAVISPTLNDEVTHVRLYRTTTGPGATYFPWVDIDGRTVTSVSDDLSDASLQLVAAPTTLGAAPGAMPGTFMTMLVEWKDRLWGVGDVDVDILRYTDIERPYAWKSSFEFNIPPVGFDQYGITGLLPRRDELGVFKRNSFVKIIGDSASRFQRIKVHTGKGSFSPEACIVIDDIGYFLAEDGVYTWGPDGIECISNGRVRKWFTTDTYFNRSRFPNSFAKYNAKYHGYELHLANAGDSTENRWIVYDIERRKWWGPHVTTALTPTCAQGFFIDSNALTVPVVGASDGKIYLSNQTTLGDAGSAISLSAETVRHSADTPNIKKLFLGPSFAFAKQAAAGNLSVACKVGALDASTTRTLSIDQTNNNRQAFSPLSEGEYCQLVFTESTLNQACNIFGYELPSLELGER